MKQRIKRTLALVLIMLLAITAVPIPAKAAAILNATSKTMSIGEAATLKVYGAAAKVQAKKIIIKLIS